MDSKCRVCGHEHGPNDWVEDGMYGNRCWEAMYDALRADNVKLRGVIDNTADVVEKIEARRDAADTEILALRARVEAWEEAAGPIVAAADALCHGPAAKRVEMDRCNACGQDFAHRVEEDKCPVCETGGFMCTQYSDREREWEGEHDVDVVDMDALYDAVNENGTRALALMLKGGDDGR